MFLFETETDTHFECPSCGQRGSVATQILDQAIAETPHVRVSCTNCSTKFEPTKTQNAHEASLPVWLSETEHHTVEPVAPDPKPQPAPDEELLSVSDSDTDIAPKEKPEASPPSDRTGGIQAIAMNIAALLLILGGFYLLAAS